MHSVAIEIISCVFRKLMPVFPKTKNGTNTQVHSILLPFILKPWPYMDTTCCDECAILLYRRLQKDKCIFT